jgi:hypothetical protein
MFLGIISDIDDDFRMGPVPCGVETNWEAGDRRLPWQMQGEMLAGWSA